MWMTRIAASQPASQPAALVGSSGLTRWRNHLNERTTRANAENHSCTSHYREKISLRRRIAPHCHTAPPVFASDLGEWEWAQGWPIVVERQQTQGSGWLANWEQRRSVKNGANQSLFGMRHLFIYLFCGANHRAVSYNTTTMQYSLEMVWQHYK